MHLICFSCRVMTPPTGVLSALPHAGTVKKNIKSRYGSFFYFFAGTQCSHFHAGKLTHLRCY